MSKHRDTLEVDLSAEAAGQACRKAISELGWRILDDQGNRLVVKEVSPQSTRFTWSARIEILIEGDGSSSEILLNGSITGMGPIQKGHLRGQLGALKNKVGLAAQDTSGSKGVSGRDDISGELERLSELHGKGVLTDEEFTRAKERLLDHG